MTIAAPIITLALNTAGVLGVGQTPQAQDVQDAFTILNDMIGQANVARRVAVIPGVLDTFPSLDADVASWSGNENVLVWNLAARLRPMFGLPEDEQQTKLAGQSLAFLNATNRQFQPAPIPAGTDTTGYGLVFLALRAAGRITDTQGVDIRSQDVSDGVLLLVEMLDEWQQDRTVTVTPGLLPVIADPGALIALTPALRSAIVWNLAVRFRLLVGDEVSELQGRQAARALATLQANNRQQVAALHPGVPATAIQVVFLALRMAERINDAQGVADTSDDVDSAFSLLVMMLAQWSKERWLVFDLVDVNTVSTGALSYTIGRGGDFDLASRAERISAAFVRMPPAPVDDAGFFSNRDFSDFFQGGDDSNQRALTVAPNAIDYPLDIITSREDYNRLGLKGLTSLPSCVFLDSACPLGRVYVWPIPARGQYELHLSVKASLPAYQTINDPLNLPTEYNEALVVNLACRILLLNGKRPSPELSGLARASLQTLRGANAQVPTLQMPGGLPGLRFGRAGGWGFGALGTAPVPVPPAPSTNALLSPLDGQRLLSPVDGALLLPS